MPVHHQKYSVSLNTIEFFLRIPEVAWLEILVSAVDVGKVCMHSIFMILTGVPLKLTLKSCIDGFANSKQV